jgi:hypothetical protein
MDQISGVYRKMKTPLNAMDLMHEEYDYPKPYNISMFAKLFFSANLPNNLPKNLPKNNTQTIFRILSRTDIDSGTMSDILKNARNFEESVNINYKLFDFPKDCKIDWRVSADENFYSEITVSSPALKSTISITENGCFVCEGIKFKSISGAFCKARSLFYENELRT